MKKHVIFWKEELFQLLGSLLSIEGLYLLATMFDLPLQGKFKPWHQGIIGTVSFILGTTIWFWIACTRDARHNEPDSRLQQ